jgi:hypothetical protein
LARQEKWGDRSGGIIDSVSGIEKLPAKCFS